MRAYDNVLKRTKAACGCTPHEQRTLDVRGEEGGLLCRGDARTRVSRLSHVRVCATRRAARA